MSLFSELKKRTPQLANAKAANPANRSGEISNFSKISISKSTQAINTKDDGLANLAGLALATGTVQDEKAANDDTPTSCSTCAHRAAKKSCGQPVLPGLSDTGGFQIVWHPRDGKDCPAWQPLANAKVAIPANREESKPPGLLGLIRRMAYYYQFTDDELAHTLEDARANSDTWRELIRHDVHHAEIMRGETRLIQQYDVPLTGECHYVLIGTTSCVFRTEAACVEYARLIDGGTDEREAFSLACAFEDGATC